MVTERRRERRLRVRIPIRISYPDNPPIYGQTENISRLGTYVEIEQEVFLGAKADVILDLPAYTNDSSLTGDVRCSADVFRCSLIKEVDLKKLYGLGIFFTDFFEQEDRNKLSKYIDFLILKEQENIKQAMQRWREKRKKQRG